MEGFQSPGLERQNEKWTREELKRRDQERKKLLALGLDSSWAASEWAQKRFERRQRERAESLSYWGRSIVLAIIMVFALLFVKDIWF